MEHTNIRTSKTNNISIVMIAGKAGSGKDTLADYLVSNYNYEKISLADSLKHMVCKKYNLTKDHVYTREGKRKQVTVMDNGNKITTVRNLLIKESYLKKEHNPDFWVDILLDKLFKINKTYKNKRIVIPDFRFPNEYSKLYQYFSDIKTINIYRTDHEMINDESENSLINFLFDYNFLNNTTKQDLYKQYEEAEIDI